MAIQTRYAGDANGINNVDAKYDGSLATIVATGLTKNPIAVKIALGTNPIQSFAAADSQTGGVVETFLRQLAIDGTVVMYQVDTNQLSVLLEATGAGSSDGTTTPAAALQTRLRTLGNATVAGGSNIWANAVTVTTSGGFKIA